MFAAATACLPAAAAFGPAVSLQHLLAEKDCEAAPELVGQWTSDGDLSGTWRIDKLGENNYRLIKQHSQSDPSNTPAFDLCVAHLGGYLFFDAIFQQLTPDGKRSLFREDDDLWIPLHFIGRLEIDDSALHFRLLDDDWLQDELKSGRVHLTSSMDDEGLFLLTAPSKELKQFAARFATDPKAFSWTEDFARAPAEEAIHAHPHLSPRTEGYGGVLPRRDST
jgi:hypothetical protein